MTLEEKFTNLEKKYKSFENDINQLIGQKHVLEQQIEDAKTKIGDLEVTQEIDEKAIEVLNLVQRSTRDKIKEAFENLVTFALQSIYQADYQFQLEFGNRGNIGELDFNLKTPETKGFLPLKDCTAGGSLDIISLAMRFVLLQVIRPKVEGFVVLDEPCKMLSKNLVQNEANFYKQINEKLGRQMIIITHAQGLIDAIPTKQLIGKA
jgi:DNA repair exonuclease SbcCD ATPase subunit